MCAGYLVGCGWWGGWRVVGALVLVSGFWMGLGSEVGVSGGWRCPVGGSRLLVGGVVWRVGPFPLDPSLTPSPAAWCAVVLGSGRPSVGWGCCSLVGVLWVAVLFWGGGLILRGACLAGRVPAGLFSTWRVGCCSRWLVRFGRVVVGGVSWWRAPWVVCLSGGCVVAGCVVPVGWADLDGRALRRPPPSPPTVHDRASQPPRLGGRTHTLKR